MDNYTKIKELVNEAESLFIKIKQIEEIIRFITQPTKLEVTIVDADEFNTKINLNVTKTLGTFHKESNIKISVLDTVSILTIIKNSYNNKRDELLTELNSYTITKTTTNQNA